MGTSSPGMMLENSKQKKGSNLGTIPENPKQKKGSNLGTMPENPKQKKGLNVSQGAKKGLCPSIRHQYHVRNPPLHIKSKSQSWKYYKHSFLRKSPPH